MSIADTELPDASHFTPYNDHYPSCELTYAVLTIYSGELPPSRVTDALKVEPSRVVVRDATLERGSHAGRRHPLNVWYLSTEREVSSLDLRRHLDWLLQRLEGRRDALSELRANRSVRMLVNCSWWSRGDQAAGPTLWPSQMAKISGLGLELGIRFSCWEDAERRAAEQRAERSGAP